ncbi:organoarsenical effux MFS transporter ArsJ [Microbulbifer sp. VAAF005]|uniref:organoarsenical effux MFS transporter ArsJ n=1 Tax=Microbulbifer sp. VAAF005 TaxID=3034230 RepID=UPI00334090F9
MQFLHNLSSPVRQYLLVTGNYWAFTLTDGALRMLVLLHFHELGYSPLQIALLFLFYEFFGVVTNLVGGWLGARIGLNRTMNLGLALQVVALSMLLAPSQYLSVPLVMAAQALSGIAKDLNKMSAKSSIKLLVPDQASGTLYRWVALLTGSKNALKGLGFFLGGALLASLGFQGAIASMALALGIVWILSLKFLKRDLGKAKAKSRFRDIFSKSPAVNILSAARLLLFASRDVWFVIALPIFLASQFGWSHWQVGTFLASWVIGYGIVQTQAPKVTTARSAQAPDGRTALFWAIALTAVPALIAIALYKGGSTARRTGWTFDVCCTLRRKFIFTQLLDSCLCSGRWRLYGCGLLLYGKCRWAITRDTALGVGIPNSGVGGLPTYFQCFSSVNRTGFTGFAQTQNRGSGDWQLK